MKYIFSKGLYKEALRKTKALTVALLVISLCWTSFYFIGSLSDYTSSIRNNAGSHFLPYDSIPSLAGILLIYIYVMGIGFALNAFSFLNKRNASDFFHGIPYSRYTLFFSNIIACATQILIIITANLLVPTLGCLISGMPLYYGFVPLVFLFCFVGSMFVLSACSIAMSITGTAFSNIVLCGLILFLPRFISTTTAATIMSRAEIVPYEALGFLLDPSYNIPVGLFLSGMDMIGFGSGLSNMFTSWGTYVYTGVMFLIYTGIAAFLFARRKSEMATNSAPGKVLQCVYRCAVGLVFAIVTAMLIIFDEIRFGTLFVAFLSLITYMLFELITTKSLKAMVKSLATYWIVIVVACVFYFSVTGMSNAFLNDVPATDDIKTVQIIPNNSMEEEIGSYKSSFIANTKLSDSELIKIASEQLEDTVRYIKHNTYYSVDYDTLCIKYNLKSGRSLTRNVWIPLDELATVNELLANDDAYVEAMKKLPKDKEIVLVNAYGLTDEQAKLVFSAYRKEVKESDMIPELSPASDYFYGGDKVYSGDMHITVSGYHSMTYFIERYDIDVNTYPQTAALYMKYSNELAQRKGAFDEMLEVMEGWYQKRNGPANERHIAQVRYCFADFENAAQYAADRKVFEENYMSMDSVYIDDYVIEGGSYGLGDGNSQPYPEDINDSKARFYNVVKHAKLSNAIGKNTVILNVTLTTENSDLGFDYDEKTYMIWVDVSDEAMRALVGICEGNTLFDTAE